MVNEKIVEAIKKARESSKKRNFKQTFDLAINLKNIDLRKPENKIKAEVNLPNAPGRKMKIGVIVDRLSTEAKDLEDVYVIKKEELDNIGKNKKIAKKIASECTSFIAEAPLMPLVGKNLGPVLAPRNLMPLPIPPTANLKSLIESRRNIIRIQLKTSPAIHLSVGTEEMADEKVAENVDAIVKGIIASLPKGKEQVKNFVIKLTMGPAIKFNL